MVTRLSIISIAALLLGSCKKDETRLITVVTGCERCTLTIDGSSQLVVHELQQQMKVDRGGTLRATACRVPSDTIHNTTGSPMQYTTVGGDVVTIPPGGIYLTDTLLAPVYIQVFETKGNVPPDASDQTLSGDPDDGCAEVSYVVGE